MNIKVYGIKGTALPVNHVFREPHPPYNISVQYAHIERALILI